MAIDGNPGLALMVDIRGRISGHRLLLAYVVLALAGLTAGAATAWSGRAFATGTDPTTSPVAISSPSPLAAPSPTPLPTPSPSASSSALSSTSTTSPTPLPSPVAAEYPVAGGTEPSVAADPYEPGVVAVVSENIVWSSEYHGCSRPAVRISRDGGATWGQPLYPWSWQCQDAHAVVAWGPGSRLWAADPVGVVGGVTVSITHSDDMGRTWSEPFVQRFAKPWSGCFPALTVDNWPASPNYGTVYVAFNPLASEYGPAVSVMASRDGSHWTYAAMPSGKAPAGYPYTWRIGYRVKAAPDGTAIVTFYQSSLRHWSTTDVLNQGTGSNIGRMGFAATTVHFDGTALKVDAPTWLVDTDRPMAEWQSGLDVDESGRAWLAVDRSGKIVLVDLRGARRELAIPGTTGFKPSLAISGPTIFVGWHARDTKGWVRTYYSLSYDGGETFSPPALVSGAPWYFWSDIADVTNGVGLRENADFANGIAYYAYGDARSGLSVYMARVRP